ncbi:unnamed protein product, partial [Prorocentrum cordatum]
VARALGAGRATALVKDNGRARGIVAGDAFRRFVGKALSQQANLGKCRVWNRGGFEPTGHLSLGTDVWVGGAGAPEEHRGREVFGAPLGTAAFAAQWARERAGEERSFLRNLPNLPDLQWAWALLLCCAVPRPARAASIAVAALRRGGRAREGCAAAAARDGFATRPTWQGVWGGARPEQTEAEPGEWKRGWQYRASAARERRYREEVVLTALTDDQQWMLDSQGGRCGGRPLTLIPSTPGSTCAPERFRARRCNGRSCRARLDSEATAEQRCRVRAIVLLRDMNLPGIAANDWRRIEEAVNGLPAHRGRQLAIDACIVSPLRRRKRSTCPELVGSRRGYLLAAGAETGGRWGEGACELLVALARARARSAPAALRGSLATALLRRWSGMLARAIRDALAASLLK